MRQLDVKGSLYHGLVTIAWGSPGSANTNSTKRSSPSQGQQNTVFRPKGPAIHPARVEGPGERKIQKTPRPTGPTIRRSQGLIKGIVGPLGLPTVGAGPFPGPLGRAG